MAGADDEAEVLREWRRSGERIALDLQGRRLHCFLRRAGSGAPLLLLHGFPAASWSWRFVLDALAQRYDVLAVDLLGFGYSDKPPDADYRIVAQADCVAALLDELGIAACHCWAHAYGCSVAQELLARHDAGDAASVQLHSAAFLNGGIFPDHNTALPAQRFLFSPLGQFLAPVLPFPYRAFKRNLLRSFGSRRPPDDDELRCYFHMLTRDGGRRVVPHLIRYMLERDEHASRWCGALEHAARAGIPLACIIGPDDPISGAQAAAWQAALPGCPLERLAPDVGHHPQMEDPEATLAAYLRFRDDIADAPA